MDLLGEADTLKTVLDFAHGLRFEGFLFGDEGQGLLEEVEGLYRCHCLGDHEVAH